MFGADKQSLALTYAQYQRFISAKDSHHQVLQQQHIEYVQPQHSTAKGIYQLTQPAHLTHSPKLVGKLLYMVKSDGSAYAVE